MAKKKRPKTKSVHVKAYKVSSYNRKKPKD